VRAVVLAGGSGKGLMPLTGGKPKVLLRVCGEAVIERVLKNLVSIGVKKVTLVTDKPAEFEDVTVRFGRLLEFEVRRQSSGGIVGAMLEAKEELSNGALLVYGDTLVSAEAYEMTYAAATEYGVPALMVVPEEDVRFYGAVFVDSRGFIKHFKESPRERVEGVYAFGGIAVLNKELMDLIERDESIESAINEYVASGNVVRTALWSDWWVDVGYPINLLEAIYYVMMGWRTMRIASSAKIASTAVIEGPVVIEDDVTIDHYAVIRGPAYIGRGALIGAHTFIRPYTDVEAGAVVSSYSEVVWSLIGEGATIGRNTFLGYSVVGDGATVGPGTLTKLITKPEEVGIKAIKVVKRRREWYKIGCTVPKGSKVPELSVLEPGEIVRD